jgi:hypothetical protein
VYILIHSFLAANPANTGSTQVLASPSVSKIITFSLLLYSSSVSHFGALNNVFHINIASHIAVPFNDLFC